jgi:Xaa-Pro aminopeptidase/Xaa-Pro dipeptidase
LSGYIAVKATGYWADMFVTVDENPAPARRQAEAALDALIATMRPGVRAGDLYAKAIDTLAPLPLHQALSASVGHGIGLSLNEQPELVAGAEGELVRDGVYTLQVGVADDKAGDVLLSAMVRNAPEAAEVLARSPSVAARMG